MSRAATDWAWDQPLKPASLKILLLSMADRADECHQCYPSIPRLVKDTSLDKKTVQAGLKRLEELGYATDTGERRGPTKRVRVFQLNLQQVVPIAAVDRQINVPKNGQIQTCATSATNTPSNLPEIGNIPKNGNIPENGQLNDPENGKLNDPENGKKNQSLEPVIESKSSASGKKSRATSLNFASWPAQPSPQVLQDWLAIRTAHRAPLTQTAVDRLAGELHKAAAAGVSVDECLGTAVELGWRGFKFAWYQNAQSRGLQTFQHAGGLQEPDWEAPAFSDVAPQASYIEGELV